jgi:hypothetical protein
MVPSESFNSHLVLMKSKKLKRTLEQLPLMLEYVFLALNSVLVKKLMSKPSITFETTMTSIEKEVEK